MAELSDPVVGGTHGWPFSASLRDLAEVGYTETEYLLSGDAQRYALADGSDYSFDGRWVAEKRGTSPFRTRFLVRRPSDPSRFNGTLVLNWNNVSNGFDNLPGMSDELLDAGVAWVGASVQKVGLHGFPFGKPNGLVQWDSKRYGDLSIPDDDLSFDIFSQIASAVGPSRPTGGGDPLEGLPVRRLLAYGVSQSANRLATYYNAIQPLTNIFDGFLICVYSGGGTRIDLTTPGLQMDEVPAVAREMVNLLPFGSHTLRTDLRAPILVLNSETEVPWYRTARQPDSDSYRLWEVAGTAHASNGKAEEGAARKERDFGVEPPSPMAAGASPNTLSFGPVLEAAFHHMERWMSGGPPAPSQARVEFSSGPPVISRDEHDNAVGGIRLPDFEAATGSHRGASPEGVPDLAGSSTAFSSQKLLELYPDREAYLARFEAAVVDGLERGFLLERDAERLRADAAGFGVDMSDGVWTSATNRTR